MDPFGSIANMHCANFICFPFYYRDTKSIIHLIYLFQILPNLAVSQEQMWKKNALIGPAVPKASPEPRKQVIPVLPFPAPSCLPDLWPLTVGNQWFAGVQRKTQAFSHMTPGACFSVLPRMATSPVSSELTACQQPVLPLGRVQPGSLWHRPSASSKGLPPALEVLYGTLHNICMGGTSVLPAVSPTGLGP